MNDKPANAPLDSDNVGERLRRLQKLGVHKGRAGLARGGQQSSAAASPAAAGIAAWSSAGQEAPLALEAMEGSQLVVTPHGPCLVIENRYPLDDTRGGWALAMTLQVSGSAVAACTRDGSLAGFDFAQAAFIDTETTGLGGGAGTLAFMVGIGTFDIAGAYVVRQVFMRHPGEERALLQVTAELLAGCTGLVSFNGRAFDAPLLATRYAMHRLPSPLDGFGHLDLLPAARQRWRLRLPSCAMGALERDILAFQRSEQDVPGWLIPSLYQDYARGGANPSPEAVRGITQIFYHNREDVASMVPLAAILCAPFEEEGRLFGDHAFHAVDYIALGRSFEALGWQETGEAAYRHALAGSLPEALRCHVLGRLGWLLKRQERRAEAVAVWQDWITSVPGPDPTPYEELAKHYEWHEVDLGVARKWTLWAIHTAGQMPPSPAREEALAGLDHRLARLERKLAGM
jgi:uncharacterized protein YprB with RNaseH-like and TPR domain